MSIGHTFYHWGSLLVWLGITDDAWRFYIAAGVQLALLLGWLGGRCVVVPSQEGA